MCKKILFLTILIVSGFFLLPDAAKAAAEILRPDAQGSEMAPWGLSQYPSEGNRWDKVDDVLPDELTTFIVTVYDGDGAYYRDLYNLPNHSGIGSINKVTIYIRFDGSPDPYRTYYKPSLKTNGQNWDGSETSWTSWEWHTASQALIKNPITNQPWTWEEIDALEIGASLKSGPNYSAKVTQIYAEIDYTVPPCQSHNVSGWAWSNMYVPPTDEQTQSDSGFAMKLMGTRLGQKKTINNGHVPKISFYMYKGGSPAGNITFTIRRTSNDSIIVSKVWGDASTLPTSPTWESVIFDSQPLINEQIYLLAEWSGSGGFVILKASGSDVKANENAVAYSSSYGNWSGYDIAYKIEYLSPPHDETIGWISFSCKNPEAPAPYDFGVDINGVSGLFSGHAWSENIGWIDFAPAGPYPASPNYSACLDFPGNGQACDGIGNYKIGGWARALNYGGGWDGWIKLRGTAQDGSPYGIDLNQQSGELSGFAWSDAVIGWISFSGNNYQVKTISPNQPPDKPTEASPTTWDNCIFLDRSIPTFYWTYIDPDDVPAGTDPQTAYILEVDEKSASFNPPIFHYVSGPTDSHFYTLNVDWLNWNTEYKWRVGVKDSHDNWSATSTPKEFKTPHEAYPYSGFSWDPQDPNQGEVVIFTPDDPGLEYLWTITEGVEKATFVDDTGPTSENPHIIFGSWVNKIKLQVTENSYSCTSAEYKISAALPLPEYREVPPIIWLQKAMASLIDFFHTF